MTTRHVGYVVTLEKDTREDDAESIVCALRMVKGVVAVEPIEADPGTVMAETRARLAIAKKLQAVVVEIYEGRRGDD